MANSNISAPAMQEAADANPLSDEYVNAVIQRHGYQSPETVIARLNQWIGLHGGENSATLLMYEAHKALSKLRAPVADEESPPTAPDDDAIAECWISASDIDGIAYDGPAFERGYRMGEIAERDRAALASAPVAGEAQKPVRWLHTLHYETGDTSEIIGDSPDSPFGTPGVDYSDTYRVTSEPLYAAPQANTGKTVLLENHVVSAPQASTADVSTVLAFIFKRFGQPGDAAELPNDVVAAMRRIELGLPAPQASEAVDESPDLQGKPVDRSAELQGSASEVDGLRLAINTCGSKVIKALAAIARANGPDTRKEDDPELIYREPVMDEVVRIRQAYDELSAALSAQPGAQKEQSDAG